MITKGGGSIENGIQRFLELLAVEEEKYGEKHIAAKIRLIDIDQPLGELASELFNIYEEERC
jgi:hypothetical protein